MENLRKTNRYTIFNTSFGWCGIVFGEGGIRKLYLPGNKKEKLKKNILNGYRNAVESLSGIKEVINSICNYFDGNNVQFSNFLDMDSMTDFQKKVYKETMKIPFGRVKTYRWLAGKVGIPEGARAVGNALGRNPVPLIIPCHRIVRIDGNLGGFSAPGGILLKKKMLMNEGINIGH